MARVGSIGFRGWSVPNEFLLEVEVFPSPVHPAVPVEVYAVLPVVGPQLMTDQGNGIYTLQRSTAQAPDGAYVIPVYTRTILGESTVLGDHAPALRLHTAPGWDLDEPADLNPSCTELEPSGW